MYIYVTQLDPHTFDFIDFLETFLGRLMGLDKRRDVNRAILVNFYTSLIFFTSIS
jgi:hypothetical protein